jgi:L-serine dehydratase
MVGPSSSHTAGAVKIGYISRKLMRQDIAKAQILLYGSFLATGKGHGTRTALVAGLLGMKPDDERIPQAIEIAAERGMEVSFGVADLKEAHPNSVKLLLEGVDGKTLEIVGESIGGSQVNIAEIDGLTAGITGDYPTLIVRNEDQPGHLSQVTATLALSQINVATLQLYRSGRGGDAVMVIECDQEVPQEVIHWLESKPGISKVTYLSLEE